VTLGATTISDQNGSAKNSNFKSKSAIQHEKTQKAKVDKLKGGQSKKLNQALLLGNRRKRGNAEKLKQRSTRMLPCEKEPCGNVQEEEKEKDEATGPVDVAELDTGGGKKTEEEKQHDTAVVPKLTTLLNTDSENETEEEKQHDAPIVPKITTKLNIAKDASLETNKIERKVDQAVGIEAKTAEYTTSEKTHKRPPTAPSLADNTQLASVEDKVHVESTSGEENTSTTAVIKNQVEEKPKGKEYGKNMELDGTVGATVKNKLVPKTEGDRSDTPVNKVKLLTELFESRIRQYKLQQK